jgi:hypothetical protein
MCKTYNINVLTVNGKSQKFELSGDMYVSDMIAHIVALHNHYIKPCVNTNEDVRLIYKGVEMDDTKKLDSYKISDGDNISIISRPRSQPININKSFVPSFESYAPSPMDTHRFSRSYENKSSPVMDANMFKLLTQIDNKLDLILSKLSS